MSVLIKGMEMPKSRGQYTLRMYVHSDGTATVEGSYYQFEGEPFVAIPVPPHGRLIDADALIDSFDPSDFWNSDAEDNCFAAVHVVNSAPTIIPAESPKEKA